MVQTDPLEVIDVSVPLGEDLVCWPGGSGIRLEWQSRLEKGDVANSSRMICDLHAGTHIDAPRHFLAKGETIDALPLEAFIGPAYVAYLPQTDLISAQDLEQLPLDAGVSRLLLKTRNSNLWALGVRDFYHDFVALSLEAARWVVERGLRLLGIDYLSVERPGEHYEIHRLLMEAGVILVETLDLSRVSPGLYEFICLPLRLQGAEASPARAVLRRLPQGRAARQ